LKLLLSQFSKVLDVRLGLVLWLGFSLWLSCCRGRLGSKGLAICIDGGVNNSVESILLLFLRNGIACLLVCELISGSLTTPSMSGLLGVIVRATLLLECPFCTQTASSP